MCRLFKWTKYIWCIQSDKNNKVKLIFKCVNFELIYHATIKLNAINLFIVSSSMFLANLNFYLNLLWFLAKCYKMYCLFELMKLFLTKIIFSCQAWIITKLIRKKKIQLAFLKAGFKVRVSSLLNFVLKNQTDFGFLKFPMLILMN